MKVLFREWKHSLFSYKKLDYDKNNCMIKYKPEIDENSRESEILIKEIKDEIKK